MPIVLLDKPINIVALDHARIANVVFEHNPAIGQRWIEFWITPGRLEKPGDPDSFMPYVNPVTGEGAWHIKVENGHHPLRPSMGLGRCDTCGAWQKGLPGGPCPGKGCGGTVEPYDGWTRFMTSQAPAHQGIGLQVMETSYRFLLDEEVPDPDDFRSMVKLLEGAIR